MKYKLGNWYEAGREVRAQYGEYWKGILLKSHNVAVIFNFAGARRIHYGDFFDPDTGTIRYVREAKTGDQTLNPRNKRLRELRGTDEFVDLFLDCGDLFTPKQLLYAGQWAVVKCAFERNLKRFAQARHAIYQDFHDVLRNKDNIAGEIGEYFAVKALNQSENNSVIRLSSGVEDIDAIQTGNGLTYAIKTIGKIPQRTSNMWAKKPAESVDNFVIVLLSHERLTPICILKISARLAAPSLTRDTHQRSWKLQINEQFLKRAQILQGKLPARATQLAGERK